MRDGLRPLAAGWLIGLALALGSAAPARAQQAPCPAFCPDGSRAYLCVCRPQPAPVVRPVPGTSGGDVACNASRPPGIAVPRGCPPPRSPSVAAGYPAPVGQIFRDCPEACPELVVIPAGEYLMGSPVTDEARGPEEQPQHQVQLTTPLAIGRTHVTRGDYAVYAREGGVAAAGCTVSGGSRWVDDPGASWRDPRLAQADGDPVVCVSWDDARSYAAWLSRRTGHVYRLLTESEWEYAARGGRLADMTPAVASTPNGFGLHDMVGSAWDWVQDCWTGSYAGAPLDAAIAASWGDCRRRVLRGGAWSSPPRDVRVASRTAYPPATRNQRFGFRVARAPDR